MASIQYTVNTVSDMARVFNESAMATEDLINRLNALSRQVADPSVDLNDADANLKILQMAKKIEQLSAKVADPEIDVKGARAAQLQIARLEAQMDRLSHKHVTVDVDVDVNRRGLRGLLSSLGGEGGLGGAFSGGLGSPGGIGALIGGGGIAAALVPGIVGLLAGGGVGAVGTALADPKGLKGVMSSIKNTIISALAPLKPAFHDILTDFDKFIKTMGPGLRDLFRASLPFMGQFVRVLEQAAKVLLPAFTQLIQQMVKSGALKEMADGFIAIADGLAAFIKNLGPGLKPSADIFNHLAHIIGDVLGFLGTVFAQIAKWLDPATSPINRAGREFVHAIAGYWDALRHNTADAFDKIRHYIAAAWDATWNGTKKIITTIVSSVVNSFRAFWHDIASIFDTVRHGIATAWDTIWRNTVTRVRNGISDVVGFFRSLPGRAINALEGLGTSLYNFAHMALVKFWNGAKSVGSMITNWFKGLAGGIIHAIKSIFGISSPSSVMFDIGKNLMHGLLNGIKSHYGPTAQAVGNIKYHVGAGVQQWAPLVRRALAMEGLSPSLLGRVLYQMQTESGGNPNAINLTDVNARNGDPSRGLMQVIGNTFRAYHWPGTSWDIFNPLANIAAALNYARHVYGPSLMSGGMGIGSGQGYALGGVITEPIWGIGRSGRSYTFGERGPETVIPGTGRGGTTNITINVAVPPTVNKRAVAREIADVLLEHTKAGGRLYPQGVTPR